VGRDEHGLLLIPQRRETWKGTGPYQTDETNEPGFLRQPSGFLLVVVGAIPNSIIKGGEKGM
jgi:hypothetical protein